MTLAALAPLLLLAPQDSPAPPQLPPGEPPQWELSTSFFYTDPPEDSSYLTALLYADRGPLHLEGRYGYEDRDTASLFAGWTWAHESDWYLSATPMLGAVFGQTEGVAPALELDTGWRRLEWYIEAEYLFDLEESDDSFFYSWSTLTYGLTDWLRAGLVTERTRQVDTDLDIQRGLALQFAVERVQLSLYSYNLGSDDDAYTTFSLDFSL